jgi:hypothetical protein
LRTISANAEVAFCPHCGLKDVRVRAADTAPLDIDHAGQTYRVGRRMAIGAACNLYRCQFSEAGSTIDGIFKIARDSRSNPLIENEAQVLRHLHAADREKRYTPFLPRVVQTLEVADEIPGTVRKANVLHLDHEIPSPDSTYTLEEVRFHHPAGLDPRDMAWIWRRLLSILGFLHRNDTLHTAVLPLHVLIEPKEHKLVLIDFCGAIAGAKRKSTPLRLIHGGNELWYPADVRHAPATPAVDVQMAARCMIDLLGGDPVRASFPDTLPPALQRHMERCLSASAASVPDAWELLEDFDRLIESLWGPRRFRVLRLPPRATA